MSWHPAGAKGMWSEKVRVTAITRIRMVELLDYKPAVEVKTRTTPDYVPYGVPGSRLKNISSGDVDRNRREQNRIHRP
jgi:hypothetical protein